MNRSSTHGAPLSQRWEWKSVLLPFFGVLGAAVLAYLLLAGYLRVAIVLTLGTVLVALARMHIQAAILASVVYLVFMGDLRRLLIPLVGWSGTDPLLLLGPIFAIILFAYAVASGSIRLNTPLAKWTAALMAIMLLQMFNPRQGPLIVGVAGALFYIIPLLWYWVGRTYATPDFMKTLLFKVVVLLAVLAAAMGYYQTFFGYLPYQMQWYNIAGYVALGSKGIQAPISFFSSSSEYASFLLIAIIVLWALLLRKKQYATLLLIIPIFVALFLTGIRGPIAKLLVTASILWAILGTTKKAWVLRGAFALLVGIAGLGWSLSNIEVSGANARVQHRVGRQVQGLTNIGSSESSASNHLTMLINGYQRGLAYPLGQGLGATTKAAAKFGGEGHSTETDTSDVFVSTGVIGGLIYLIMIFLIIRSTIRYWTRTRSVLAMALMGILAITFFVWLRGGRYAVSPLVWLCIGALDQFQNAPGTKAPQNEEQAAYDIQKKEV